MKELSLSDDSFTSAVAVDGCFYQPNFTALVPSLFVLSNEDAQKETYIKMKNVMWQNNICEYLNILVE